jgi:hypothetical protein
MINGGEHHFYQEFTTTFQVDCDKAPMTVAHPTATRCAPRHHTEQLKVRPGRLVFSAVGTLEGDELDGTHPQRHIIGAPESPRGGAAHLLTGRNCRD